MFIACPALAGASAESTRPCRPCLPALPSPGCSSPPARRCEEHPLFTLGPSSKPHLSVCPPSHPSLSNIPAAKSVSPLLTSPYRPPSHPSLSTRTCCEERSAASTAVSSRSWSRITLCHTRQAKGNKSCNAAPSFRRLSGWVAGAHKATVVPPRLLTAHTSCRNTAHLCGLQVGEEPLLRH